MPSVGGEERLVVEDAKDPEVLRDGSLLVHRFNEKRRLQIYRFWPDSGRLRAYPGLPFSGVTREFRDGKEAAFYGRSTDQPDTDPNNYLYAVDLASATIRRIVTNASIDSGFFGFAMLDVSADDQAIVMLTLTGDLTKIVAIPRRGGPARELTSLTQPVWGINVAANGDIYVDQVLRPQEALLMDADGSRPQTIFTTTTNFLYIAPTVMPDGRVLFTATVNGRRRLLGARPRANPQPFVQTTEETSGPVVMVGSSEVAFLLGAGPAAQLAIASAADGRIVRGWRRPTVHRFRRSPPRRMARSCTTRPPERSGRSPRTTVCLG